ncbi:hypothetical protein [Azospirillum argentinense]
MLGRSSIRMNHNGFKKTGIRNGAASAKSKRGIFILFRWTESRVGCGGFVAKPAFGGLMG